MTSKRNQSRAVRTTKVVKTRTYWKSVFVVKVVRILQRCDWLCWWMSKMQILLMEFRENKYLYPTNINYCNRSLTWSLTRRITILRYNCDFCIPTANHVNSFSFPWWLVLKVVEPSNCLLWYICFIVRQTVSSADVRADLIIYLFPGPCRWCWESNPMEIICLLVMCYCVTKIWLRGGKQTDRTAGIRCRNRLSLFKWPSHRHSANFQVYCAVRWKVVLARNRLGC